MSSTSIIGDKQKSERLEKRQLKNLQRENVELKRTNQILKKASAYFAQAELDRRPK